MVATPGVCPQHWKRGCHPHPCTHPAKPLPVPPQPAGTPAPAPATHNVVYLVDEHVIADVNDKPKRNANTVRRRYAWHYSVANLTTFNVPEKPDTIELHEKIGNPGLYKIFRWEGYMFDIPGGDGTVRVGIVAGADLATDATLTGPGGANKTDIDRVVGFAGIYPDNSIPFGPIVQVRRDDAYRRLGACFNGDVKVAWHCAYYITKETPRQPTPGKTILDLASFASDGGNPDEAPATDQNQAADQAAPGQSYDQMMDNNVADDICLVPGKPDWGGMVFGFSTKNIEPSDENKEFEPYDDSAIDELKSEESKNGTGEPATS